MSEEEKNGLTVSGFNLIR